MQPVEAGGSANPDFIPLMQSYLAAGGRRAARQTGMVRVVMGAVCVTDDDRARARHAARRSGALYLPVVAPLDPTVKLEPELVMRLQLAVNAGDLDAVAGLISDDLLDRFAFAGNAADLIQQVERLFAAGAGRIEFGTPHGLTPESGLRILGEQVISMHIELSIVKDAGKRPAHPRRTGAARPAPVADHQRHGMQFGACHQYSTGQAHLRHCITLI